MVNPQKLGQKQRNKIRQTSIVKLPTNKEKIKLLLRYGILAPSTHNTQPWKFEIIKDKLKIFVDFSKKIPVADPTERDMYISIGALIKNIELAASEYQIKIKTLVSKDIETKDLVAVINFKGLDTVKEPTNKKILNSILRRQNYRGFFKEMFDKKAFDLVLNNVISPQRVVKAKETDKEESIEELAQLTVKGLRMAYAMPEFRAEIGSLINHNFSRKRHGLHGYSLRMNTPQSFIIPKVMRRKDIGAKLGALNYKSFIQSPRVMVLATKNDDKKSWLAVGQIMEEIMIRAVSSGMTTSIYSAAIEMPGLRSEVSRIFKLSKDYSPQILFCIGKPDIPLPYSARRNIDEVLT